MSDYASQLLSQTIDAYINWFATWHRHAFLKSEAAIPESPPAFQEWRKSAARFLSKDQPAVEKIVALHDQLHTLARLVVMKAPEGQLTDLRDYESVLVKYQELMQGLRRLERAFSVAASGLDTLTGLRSRIGLSEDLMREQNRFLRTGRPFCLALMDIDHFKKINDTHGHDAGDKVLAAVADHISRDLRSFDDAWRWGGEEFLLCLKEADAAISIAVLERLRAHLAASPVMLADGKSIPVTASFGFAISLRDVPPEDLIRSADQALYRAKTGGRNKVEGAESAKAP